MPTVWRVAFRSPSAESAIVNVILNVRDEHMTAVLLCEDLDSNLRDFSKQKWRGRRHWESLAPRFGVAEKIW